MSKLISYTLYDVHDEAVFCGTASECAEYLGCTVKQFSSGFDKYRKYKKHRIERQITERDAELIRKWDETVAPLREKYGIPVYKAKDGRR